MSILKTILDHFRNDPHDWTKGDFSAPRLDESLPSFGHCLLGAYPFTLEGSIAGVSDYLLPSFINNCHEYKLLSEIIPQEYPDLELNLGSPFCIITSFNDNDSTTYDDVILVLEKAVARLEEEV